MHQKSEFDLKAGLNPSRLTVPADRKYFRQVRNERHSVGAAHARLYALARAAHEQPPMHDPVADGQQPSPVAAKCFSPEAQHCLLWPANKTIRVSGLLYEHRLGKTARDQATFADEQVQL